MSIQLLLNCLDLIQPGKSSRGDRNNTISKLNQRLMMNTNGRFLDVASFEMTQFFWVCQFLGLIPYCTFLKVSKLSNVHQKSLNTYTFKHLHCHLYREKSESSSSPDRQTDRLLNVFVCSFFNCCVLFIYSLFIFYLISSNHIKMSLLSCWSASTPVTAATILT